ncbi:TetR/AcrR family transcriptional regulator [Mycobacterium deserti]|uniref:TetR/AcrR family transcriptional regulator n=1 Tax=Mycobacterium deserti TaxID=2978347 RepID=A0ABT2M6R4_9MYCO|nr:TetR/AcrR family transcriptional regulator [Mycobacterium deserti]MCT7657100.1 TetR/AcrR family transcriptional regulator [Mycobacterium deserti]
MTTAEGLLNPLEISRGERTRSAILDASRRLFLERGFGGTSINAITDACGISRAGFYTYFKDKTEVFNVLGKTAYHDALAVIENCAAAVRSDRADAVTEWVREYFDYMDRHGAFVTAAAHTAPDNEEFRRSRNHMMTRAAWKLGHAIRADGKHSPEVIGIAAMGLLDRSWYAVEMQSVAVDRGEIIAVIADSITAMARG